MDRAVAWMVVITVSTITAPWRLNKPGQKMRARTRAWPTTSWVKLKTRSAWKSKVRGPCAVLFFFFAYDVLCPVCMNL